MSFKSKLYYILEDISKHKATKSDAFELHIQKRLDKALAQYIEDTNKSVEFLSNRDSINVLKKLNREWYYARFM